jgi:hypothetical protein
MHHPRIVTLTVAAALLGAVVASVPAAAHLVTAEPLGATTTLTVTHSGSAELVLYDDATLSPAEQHNPDVDFSGPGRLVGFDLVRSDDDYSSSGPGGADELEAARVPGFAGGSTFVGGSTAPQGTCSPYPNATVPLQQNCTAPNPKAIVLHEGYYHLVVLADGGPLRITLHLHGVGRSTAAIRLQSTFRSTEKALPQRESIGSDTVTYGTELPFAGATEIATVVSAKLHAGATLLADGFCVRADDGAPPPDAYSPACPGGRSASFSFRLGPTGEFGVIGLFGSPVPSSTSSASNVGMGGSFTDTSGPSYTHGLGVWIAGVTLNLPYYNGVIEY